MGLKPNYDDYMQQWEEKKTSEFDINEWVKDIPKDSIFGQFPYSRYISTVDISDLVSINRDIKILDSITGDHFISLSVFLLAYTDSLKPHVYKKLST